MGRIARLAAIVPPVQGQEGVLPTPTAQLAGTGMAGITVIRSVLAHVSPCFNGCAFTDNFRV